MGDRSITIKKVSSATKSSNRQLVNEKWYELENKGIIRGIRKAGRSPFYKWMRLLFLGFIYMSVLILIFSLSAY
ncbi:hypothetical protein CHH80_08885 [Bacillus sp. 7504-2]|nr:hypothetical protein CHH80_08885 [Bacillus sp. 7504-2]